MKESAAATSWGSVAFRDYGGPIDRTVVLAHGGGRSLADWELVRPLLGDDIRVVSVDLPGHGRSTSPSRWRWEDASIGIDAVLDEVGGSRAVVVGHSLGGMAMVSYARSHPECRGVVNIDGHGVGGPSAPAEVRAAAEEARAAAAVTQDTGDDTWMRKEVDAMRPQAPGSALESADVRPLLERSFERQPGDRWARKPSNAFAATIPTMGSELFSWYRALSVPLLIFHCTSASFPEVDASVMKASHDALAADLRELRRTTHAEVVSIPKTHMVILEDPAAVVTPLRDFIDRAYS
jgi:pimeloyl-ACP methyl ester carboxylesterase